MREKIRFNGLASLKKPFHTDGNCGYRKALAHSCFTPFPQFELFLDDDND